jgi:hypothetical protein
MDRPKASEGMDASALRPEKEPAAQLCATALGGLRKHMLAMDCGGRGERGGCGTAAAAQWRGGRGSGS